VLAGEFAVHDFLGLLAVIVVIVEGRGVVEGEDLGIHAFPDVERHGELVGMLVKRMVKRVGGGGKGALDTLLLRRTGRRGAWDGLRQRKLGLA
jgi:hypothetical protein